MSQHLSNTIVRNTYSVGDLFKRADLLQRFFEHYFFQQHEAASKRAELMREYYKDGDSETKAHVSAIIDWDTEILDGFTADNLYECIRDLKQAVRTLPRLILYVPVHLNLAQVERIGAWCRKQLGAETMLDMRTDPSAVGGCAFAYNDAFHDLSFSYYLRKQRDSLVQLIRTYES